jgi:phosphoglycerol transferase MdoB-like AlkP superfamily enzyme
MPTLLQRLYLGARLAVRATLLAAGVQLLFRLAFLHQYAGGGTRLPPGDLWRALLMGLRFDLKVGAAAAAPLLLLGALWAPGKGRAAQAAWAFLAALSLAVCAMINDGYYGFYHVPIDPIVFGLFEDDTGAVFTSLWAEHHLLSGSAFAVALAAAQAWWVTRPLRRAPAGGRRAAAALLAPLVLFLAIRGRLGGFPLNAKDFSVSTEALLNAAVPNGAIALSAAAGERLKVVNLGKDPYAGLRAAGFRHPADAAAVLGLTAPDAADAQVAEALFTRSRQNPWAAAHPPHVVLVVMESWGGDLLRYHSEKNDLLGRLAPHVARGLLFQRFVAAQNGTDPTLEALLFNTPLTPLTSGPLGHLPLTQAAVRPFHDAGYRTVFGMGWSSTWRAIGRAYPNQGFDEVRDVTDVVKAVPDAPVGTWGVPDGALLRWAAQRLQEADARGERLLLVLMTATNHSPYELPAGYQVRPLDPDAYAGRAQGERAVGRAQLEGYQYACDAVGEFLDQLDASGLSARTIVAATGDHNTREFFQYPGSRDLPWRDRVPLLLAVPPAYLGEARPDLSRWAGHRDIFPTLAGLALSGARVFRSGDDLIVPPSRPPRALARYETVLSDAGVAPQLERRTGLCWGADGELAAQSAAPCWPVLEPIVKEERAYKALLDWNVRSQVLAAKGAAAAR